MRDETRALGIIAAAILAIMAMGLLLAALAASSATTTGSLEPTTGTWRAYRGADFATLVCSTSSEAAMLTCVAADAERRATSTRYQLRYPNRYVSVTYSAPPPPTTSTWTFCSNEWATCSFTGSRRVRFGANTSWVERDLTAVNGGIVCRISTFGSDPLVGVTKRCELRAVTTEPGPSGTATLSWQHTTPPAIAGFRIVHGADPTVLPNAIQIANPALRTYTVSNLPPGTRCFAVKAYDATDVESLLSNVVCRVIM